MKFSRSYIRLLVLLSIAFGVCVLGTPIVRALPGMHLLEMLVYNWHVGALPPLPADDRIVIVGMDSDSLARLPIARPVYPLPRTIHAQLLRELHAGGAKVVGFDVMFISDLPQEDEVFAKALKESGLTLGEIEPETLSLPDVETFRIHEIAPILRPYIVACSQTSPRFYGKVVSIRSSIVSEETSQRYIHLSVALAAFYRESRAVLRLSDAFMREQLEIGSVKVPVESDGQLQIRFAGPPGTFRPVPYSEVYSGEWRRTRGEGFFKDKIVLVGAIEPRVDQFLTPLGEMHGVEILAQTTQQILSSNWIRHWEVISNFICKFVICSILALAIWRFDLRKAAVIAAGEGFIWIFGAHELFARSQVWVDTVEPIGTMVLSLIVSTAYEAARMRGVFRRFMPSAVADEMLHAGPGAEAETVEKEVTIVFCDIRDSTKLGEAFPPDRIEELLRRYFVAGEEAAIRLGTELDKFVGDEIMLFFEDRKGYEDHAIRGVRWALAIQDAAREITESGLAGEIGFRVGVGVCTGRARLGLIGAKQRVQHTVVGDAVNTASRLQSATKEVNRGIVIGESTWARAKPHFRCEDLGTIAVKGKQEPVRIFCPTGILDRS
jgi:adenylate cyclase